MIILREWYFIGRKFGELKKLSVSFSTEIHSWVLYFLSRRQKSRWKLVFHFLSWIERGFFELQKNQMKTCFSFFILNWKKNFLQTKCLMRIWIFFVVTKKKGKNCCSIVVLLKVHKSDDECFQHRRARGQLVHPALGFSIHRWINVPASLKVSCDLSLFEFYAPTHSDCKRIQISSIYVTAIHKSDHNLKLQTIVFNVVLLIYYNNIVLLYFIVIKFINLIENILD